MRIPRILPALVALLALTAVAYLPILGNGFISIDDPAYVTGNQAIRDGVTAASVRWAMTTNRAGNWHPVAWISHALDVQLFGTDPAGHHAVSLLLHLLNTSLIFLALASLTGSATRSLAVAALFALHPLHVESVAWVSERKDLLCALFFLLALAAWGRYVRRPGAARYAAVVALFVLALASKPMAVTFPFVLLLLDWWPLQRLGGMRGGGARPGPGALLLEKVPLFLLSAASATVTYLVQRQGGWVKPVESYPLGVRVANALTSCLSYLRKTAWPSDLAMPYGHPGWTLGEWRVSLAAALLAASTVLALRLARRAPHLAVGWFWFLGMLVPVIGLVQVADQSMADRYTYLPLTGIFLAAVWALFDLVARYRAARVPVAAATFLLLAALSALTWRQASFWRDDGTLFGHAVLVSPGNDLAVHNLAATLIDEGKLAEAGELYAGLLARGPDRAGVRNNMGTLAMRMDRLDEAEAHLRRALELDPGYGLVHFNLARVLDRGGRLDEAVVHYREARSRGLDTPDLPLRMAQALARGGHLEEAASLFAEAVALRPASAEARFGLGKVLILLGRDQEGRRQLDEAMRLRGSGVGEAAGQTAPGRR